MLRACRRQGNLGTGCVRSAGEGLRSEAGGDMITLKRGGALPSSSWKGQASIEFTMMSFFALAFLLASSFIYYQEGTEALELKEESEMRSICASLSAKVSGLEIAGPGSSVKLDYPSAGRGGNYSIWVHPDEGTVHVVRQDAAGEYMSVGCLLKTRGVGNLNGSDVFEAAVNGTVRNADGVVVFG